MTWDYRCEDGSEDGTGGVCQIMSLTVATRADALRILEAWGRNEKAEARSESIYARLFNGAWRHPDNRGGKDVKNISFKRLRRYWSAEGQAGEAFSRAVDVCRSLNADACLYGEKEHDVNPMYDELCDAIRAVLRAQREDTTARRAVTLGVFRDGEWQTLISVKS